MKKNIFLYLFVFMALIALYQYVNATHILKDRDDKIVRLKSDATQLKDSIQKLQIKVLDMQYFSLETNEKKRNNPLVP